MAEQKQSEELKKAIAERDIFIERHPTLRIFQGQIDSALSTTKDPIERIGIIFTMMKKRNNELQEAINECKIIYNSLPEDIRKGVKLDFSL